MLYKILLFVGVVLNVFAQFFLKLEMKNNNILGNVNNAVDLLVKIIHLFVRPFFILSLFLYGTSFVIYSITLSKLELSKAYPVSSAGAIILIFILSIIFFSESMNWGKILGIVFCIVGIFLIFR